MFKHIIALLSTATLTLGSVGCVMSPVDAGGFQFTVKKQALTARLSDDIDVSPQFPNFGSGTNTYLTFHLDNYTDRIQFVKNMVFKVAKEVPDGALELRLDNDQGVQMSRDVVVKNGRAVIPFPRSYDGEDDLYSFSVPPRGTTAPTEYRLHVMHQLASKQAFSTLIELESITYEDRYLEEDFTVMIEGVRSGMLTYDQVIPHLFLMKDTPYGQGPDYDFDSLMSMTLSPQGIGNLNARVLRVDLEGSFISDHTGYIQHPTLTVQMAGVIDTLPGIVHNSGSCGSHRAGYCGGPRKAAPQYVEFDMSHYNFEGFVDMAMFHFDANQDHVKDFVPQNTIVSIEPSVGPQGFGYMTDASASIRYGRPSGMLRGVPTLQ